MAAKESVLMRLFWWKKNNYFKISGKKPEIFCFRQEELSLRESFLSLIRHDFVVPPSPLGRLSLRVLGYGGSRLPPCSFVIASPIWGGVCKADGRVVFLKHLITACGGASPQGEAFPSGFLVAGASSRSVVL